MLRAQECVQLVCKSTMRTKNAASDLLSGTIRDTCKLERIPAALTPERQSCRHGESSIRC